MAHVLLGNRSYQRLALSGVLLSALSCAVILHTASEEPFTVFLWSDGALIIGLGAIVFVLFAAWAVACVRNFRQAPQRSVLATVLVSASVLWTAINLVYLGQSIYGYAQDLTNPNFGVFR